MADVITELMTFLDGKGDVGSLAAGTIAGNRMPDGADVTHPITVLTEGGGSPGERNFGEAGLNRERPTLQVRVRGAIDAQAPARARIEAVKNHLVTIMATTVEGTFYYWLNEFAPVALLGWDEERRPTFVWVGVILKELS